MSTTAAISEDQLETFSPQPSTTRTALSPFDQPAPALALRSRDFSLFYFPAMLAVYTARHQQMPLSAESLRGHVFGSHGQPGCSACREETDFLVAHQKQFF